MLGEHELRQIQMHELELLLEFRKMCEENDLTYYLTGGTLLGAVRHKGFIPWDDDIDIAMPRKDYNLFLKLCAHSLGADYIHKDERTAIAYPHYFSKLTFAEHAQKHKRAYIDIFPLDICPDKDFAAIVFFKSFVLITSAIEAKVTDNFICGYSKPYMIFLWNLLRRFPLKILYPLRHCIRKIFSLFGSGQRLCNVGGLYGFPGEVCEKASRLRRKRYHQKAY